jgi:hypothetical protein
LLPGRSIATDCQRQCVDLSSLVFGEIIPLLDNRYPVFTRPFILNPNTHQKIIFCVRLQQAVGLALCIFPAQPGTTK